MSVPLYKVFLKSNVVSGPVTVGFVPSIPIIVHLCAGEQSETQVFVTEPCVFPEIKTLVKEHPEVFSACVVTRAQSRNIETRESAQQEEILEGLAGLFFF